MSNTAYKVVREDFTPEGFAWGNPSTLHDRQGFSARLRACEPVA